MAPDVLTAREEQIDALALRQYEEKNRKFTPLYPWVFVRVLPKEQTMKSGIILPAIEQNKTVHEAIVLAVWQPKYVKGNQLVSSFSPGDHVLLPHWAGLPVEGFSAKHYRVVKEEGWRETQDGGIFARVDYDEERPVFRLRDLLVGENLPEDMVEHLVRVLEARFLLVDREGQSVTLSGR